MARWGPSTESASARLSPTPTPAGPFRAPASATSPRLSSRAGSRCCSGRRGPPKPRAGAEMPGSSAPFGQSVGWEPAPDQGWVAPHVAAEFPGLGIASVTVDARPGNSPDAVRRRLRALSDRFYGAHAIHLRERPIPWAYRVFYRHIGLDPDRTRPAIEQLALDRLRDGAFKSRGLPDDALTIAIVET